jgi:MFS transporter, OFA family, oxalate/formate antiporter
MSAKSPRASHAWGWYYGWNIIAIAVLSQVSANGIALNSFSLFLHDWAAELHSPISSLQLVILPMITIASLISPLAGILADKFPARWLMGGGTLGIAVFCLLISTVTATWQVYVLYGALLPFAVCFSTSVVANALVSRWFVRRIGLALGLTAFGVGLAGALLPPVIGAAMPSLGWRGIFRVASLVIALVVVPLIVMALRDRPTSSEGRYYLSDPGEPHRGPRLGAHDGTGVRSDGLGWRNVIARKNFWLLLAVFLPIMAIYGGCTQNLAPIAASHGLTQRAAGTLLSVLSVCHVTSSLVLGLVSDRFGNRLPLAGLAIVMAAGSILIALSVSLSGMVLAVALVGIGGGVWTLLAAAIAAEFGAVGFGRAFGLIVAFLPLNALVPFAIAKTQESTGSYAPALFVLAVIAVIGGALCLLIGEGQHGESPGPSEHAPLSIDGASH